MCGEIASACACRKLNCRVPGAELSSTEAIHTGGKAILHSCVYWVSFWRTTSQIHWVHVGPFWEPPWKPTCSLSPQVRCQVGMEGIVHEVAESLYPLSVVRTALQWAPICELQRPAEEVQPQVSTKNIIPDVSAFPGNTPARSVTSKIASCPRVGVHSCLRMSVENSFQTFSGTPWGPSRALPIFLTTW